MEQQELFEVTELRVTMIYNFSKQKIFSEFRRYSCITDWPKHSPTKETREIKKESMPNEKYILDIKLDKWHDCRREHI
jgi:hypothetical protein